MADFEYITRPFMPLDVRPAPKETKAEPLTPDNTVLQWGSPGASAFELRANARAQTDDPRDEVETSRKYDVVKVKNRDDPDQFVEVEVMSEYQARNKIDDKRVKLAFGRIEPADNIEIIARNKTRTNT